MTGWDFERYCERLGAETAMFAADINAGPSGPSGPQPGLPVATCPGWTVADVIGHTGGLHRWVEHMVSTRATGPADRGAFKMNFPGDPGHYPGWLADGAGRLEATLRAAGPRAPVWTPGPDHSAGWWARRMVHETAVHRADVVLAQGRTPRFDAEQAADGIDEFLALLPYSSRTREAIRALPAGGESIHLHATDSDGEWMIRLTPGGMTWERGHGKGTTAVRGTVGTLLLFAYGRVGAASPAPGAASPAPGATSQAPGAASPAPGATSQALEVFGDRDLLADWTARTAL